MTDSTRPRREARDAGRRWDPPVGGNFFIEPDGSNREEVRRLGYRFIDLLVDSASHAGDRLPLDRDPGPEIGPYQPSEAGRAIEDLLPEIERVLKHGMNPAKMELARELVTLAHHLMLHEEEYQPRAAA